MNASASNGNNQQSLRLAIDLGTTTLAGQLLSPQGAILAEATLRNPQQAEGADILSRLQAAHEGAGSRLQVLLVDGLRMLLTELVRQAGIKPQAIRAAAAAGNPGMSCLLRNLPVDSLLFPPHKPPYKELTEIQPDNLNLGLATPLQLFPLVSGFVGGDLVAVLFGHGAAGSASTGSSDPPQPGTVAIDIGTNGEVAVRDASRWWVSSAAAGPAFEGGNISAGMVMTRGAVSNVTLAGDRLRLTVAGGGQPSGLCGSGLAALVAAAREGGLLEDTGRVRSPDEVPSNLAGYLIRGEDGWGVRFYRDAERELTLSQTDVRNFQLAKGALRAGVEVLLERAGIAPQDVSRVLVTGALGTALPSEVLKRVALLPEPMLDKTLFTANGVLTGLRRYLTEPDGARRLQTLLNSVQPFPLSGTPAFEKRFLAAMNF